MNIYQERIEALLAVMEEEKVDYYLIPTADFHNSEYVDDYFKEREFMCGFTGSNGTLVLSKEEQGLWTDGRYFIQAEKELSGSGVKLFKMGEEGVPTILNYLKDHVKEGDCVGFDGRCVDATFGKTLEIQMLKRGCVLKFDSDLVDRIWTDRPSLPSHEMFVLDQKVAGVKFPEKLEKVREKMNEEECDALFISKLDDLMWLFNIRGADVECNPVALSYGYITKEQVYLFVQDSEVTDAIRSYAATNEIILRDYEEIVPFLNEYAFEDRVMAEEANISFLFYKMISSRTELVDAPNPTELLKAIKSEQELSLMREFYLKDSVAVTKFIYWLKKNIGKKEITEYSAAMYLDNLRSQIDGFLDLSFPTISAYAENAAMMHYEATKDSFKILAPKGQLLVDSGAQYLGATTDITRTITLGKLDENIIRDYCDVAKGMLALANAKWLYGCTGKNLDILARKPLWERGIDYKCGTGHGIGYILNVHEGPQNIRWKFGPTQKEAVLEEGMDVTDEPGVYIEGSHGIRIENVLVVRKAEKTSDGQFMEFEMLTYTPLDRDALKGKYFTKEELAMVNAYQKQVYDRTAQFLTPEERQWLAKETAPIR